MRQVPFTLTFLPAPACAYGDLVVVLSVLLPERLWLQIPSSPCSENPKNTIQEGFCHQLQPWLHSRCDVPATKLSPGKQGPARTSSSRLCHGLDLQLHHRSDFGTILRQKPCPRYLRRAWPC